MPKLAFEFTPEAYDDIVRLQQATEAENLAQVLQTALCLMTSVRFVLDAGYQIGILKDGQIVRSIELP